MDEIGYTCSWKPPLSIPLGAVLLNVEASSHFGNTLSDLLSEGQKFR